MKNNIKFPAALYDMNIIDPNESVSIDTEYNLTGYYLMGSKAAFTSVNDLEGQARVTQLKHGFLTGDTIVIEGGTQYDGTHTVTRISGIYYTIGMVYDGTASGTARITDDEIVYSPLTGEPAVRCIGRSGDNSVFTLSFTNNQTIYPNVGFAVRTVGHVNGVDGSLDTSSGSSNYTPSLLVSAESDPSILRTTGYNYRSATSGNGFTDQWRFVSCLRRDFNGTAGADLESWATDANDQGFVTQYISFEQPSTTAVDAVFYLGGIATKNIEKAKLIIGFDSWHADAHANCFPVMNSRGWKGQLYTYAALHDDAEYKERIQDAYDIGWDVSNHTYNHNTVGDSLAGTDSDEDDLIRELCRAKEWQLSNGWRRGAEFIAYAGTVLRLSGNNGADLADKYFKMGRGRGYRSEFYNNTHSSSDGYEAFIPNDNMNISHLGAATGSNTDYSASTTKSSLVETVNHRGVLNLYIHDVKESPAAGQVSTAWWSDFIADVAAKEASGELEVVTMTDWYNEIYGTKYSPAASSGGNNLYEGNNNVLYK